MPRRGFRKRPDPLADLSDPQGLPAAVVRYIEWMRVHSYSEHTVRTGRALLRLFVIWCQEREIRRPTEVTRALLERYQRHLYYHRKADGQPLTVNSQYVRLAPLRPFFRWLARNHVLLYNPAADLEFPKLGTRLPRVVLTAAEAEEVMRQPDLGDPLGLRDRAILETLYSTGMRRFELIGLEEHDLDVARGTVLIRAGKGRKDRVVPIGERALHWIAKYLGDVRPMLVRGLDEGVLFLLQNGKPVAPEYLSELVRLYVDQANLGKRGSCHLLRHTMATVMLEGGADIRFIQEMLGHVKVSTTQIYTRVSIGKLKEIHTATHPAARLLRPASSDERPSERQ